MPITKEVPAWPGTPLPAQQWLERLQAGEECDVSAWTIGAHAGTHLDAPSHFIPGGADVEGLKLHDIEPGEYYLVAVPPRFQHAEASPVRAILLDFQGIFRR